MGDGGGGGEGSGESGLGDSGAGGEGEGESGGDEGWVAKRRLSLAPVSSAGLPVP